MKSEIDKDKIISPERQKKVEHDFEALVGSRKRRYCNTPERIRRTEFFEDYYLLYNRQSEQIRSLEEQLKKCEMALELSCEKIKDLTEQDCPYELCFDCEFFDHCNKLVNEGRELECEQAIADYYKVQAKKRLAEWEGK